MNIITAYSDKKSIEEVVKEIKDKFESFKAKMVIFFASSVFDPVKLSQKMKEAFVTCPIFGCTTAGEIISGKMLKNSVVAMAFNSKVIDDVKVEVVENIKQEDKVKEAFSSFEKYYNVSMKDMDFKKYVGIILVDGLSSAEEKLMDKIEKYSKSSLQEYKDNFLVKLKGITDGLNVDEGRIELEAAIFAEKSDITEEIIRTKSHLIQFNDLLSSDEPIGRKMDFIVQEINREINTIGSKNNDLEVTSLVILVKSELEKIREQAKNIE